MEMMASRELRRAPEAFEDILYYSILEGMRNLLGEECMRAALYHLRFTRYTSPQEFHEKLVKVFKEGAITIERIIVKEMYSRIDLPYVETAQFDFIQYCELAKSLITKGENVKLWKDCRA